MITRIADMISTFFCTKAIIKDSEKDKCRYGLEIMISTIIGFMVIILTGVIFGSTSIAVVYLLCIVPLRTYTGGYHANTYLTCNIVFTLIFVVNLFLYKLIIVYDYKYKLLGFTLLFAFLALRYVPVANRNKKLTLKQQNKYRKISFTLYCIYFFVSLLLIQYSNKCGVLILLVLNTVSFLVLEVKVNEKVKLQSAKIHC